MIKQMDSHPKMITQMIKKNDKQNDKKMKIP